jgi:iron-sulfur cluster assembly protein
MIEVTNEAICKAVEKLENASRKALLVGLVPSVCHGYSYLLEYSDGADMDTHTEFSFKNLVVYINNKSLPLLTGMTLDYAYEGLNEGFKFVNPNLTNECGCGESVSA